MTWKKPHISLQKIEEEYADDIFVDDDWMYKLKEVIDELDDLDKAILLFMQMKEVWPRQVRNSMFRRRRYIPT